MKPINMRLPCFSISFFLMMLIVALSIETQMGLAQPIADTLREINIQDKKEKNISQDLRIKEFATGQRLVTIDSALLRQYQTQQVTQLLQEQFPVFIRSSGINSMATLNFRGSSAAQSQVYWNGIPIQNAALGITDISNLPVSAIHQLQILYGSSAALLGSGNVGGALLLESLKPRFDTATHWMAEAAIGMGSYRQYQGIAQVALSHKKFFIQVNGMAQTAANNFTYHQNGTQRTNEHAQLSGASSMLQTAYQVNNKNTLRVVAWHQQYQRDIPPALFENISTKKRKDRATRIMAEWNRDAQLQKQYFRIAYLKDILDYQDSAIHMFTTNTSQQYFAEAGWRQSLSPHRKILVFAPIQVAQMPLRNGMARQTKYALAVAYTYTLNNNNGHLSLHTREEVIDGKFVFLPGMGIDYSLTKDLQLRANAQRTYRNPTLNEQYFEPGGNLTLKPEIGWAVDMGWNLNIPISKQLLFSCDLAYYYREINDWIAWFGGAIWTPHNLATVRSTGAETDCRLIYRKGNLRAELGWKGAYTSAVTTKSYLPNDGSIGKQIPYTPQWINIAQASITYCGYSLHYTHTFTGARYYNTDETGYLPSFTLGSARLGKDFYCGDYCFRAAIGVNNILSESYTVVAYRPMPERNIALSLTLIKK